MRIDNSVSSLGTINPRVAEPYNAVLAYKVSSGAIRAFGMVVTSVSYSINSVSSSTQTRFANVISSGYYHTFGAINISGNFRSQAEQNQFAEFIRGWHYDVLRRSKVSLLRFVCDIDGSKIEHDVIIDEAGITYKVGDGAVPFGINLIRADRYTAGDSKPRITTVHSSYIDTLAAEDLDIDLATEASRYTSGYYGESEYVGR